MKCCVPFCASEQWSYEKPVIERPRVAFFKFPTTPWLQNSWLVAIGINEKQLPPDAVVCSQHFRTDDLLLTTWRAMKLRNNSIPSIFRDDRTDIDLKFCMICLDTGNNIIPLSKYLSKAYTHVTGLDFTEFKNHICYYKSEPKICGECTQRLINCYKFREKSKKTHHLIIQLYNSHGMLTLDRIKTINRVDHQLTSNLVKHIIKPDHCDLYVTEEDLVDDNIQQENIYNSDNHTEKCYNTILEKETMDYNSINHTEVNTDKGNNNIVEEETLDFDIDIDDETEYFSDKDDLDIDMKVINKNVVCDKFIESNIKHDDITSDKVIIIRNYEEMAPHHHHHHINQLTSTAGHRSFVGSSNVHSLGIMAPQNDINNYKSINDDRFTDIEFLDDDTDDDTEYLDDYDSYLKFLNNNIVTKNDIYNGRLTKIITNTTQKKDVVSDKKNIVSLKNILLVKDIKSGITKPIKKKQSKVDIICKKNVLKRRKNPFKLQVSDLKLFTVIELSYEEQLAEIQMRKCSLNYKRPPYKCTICYKGQWHTIPHNRHMEKHTNKYGLFVCAVCGFHVKTRTNLVTHIQSNHQFRYSCRSCPYVTTSIWPAKAHEQWHEGKMFKCQHCGIKIAKRSSYFNHIRIKHPSSTHVCSLCGYSFVSDIGLKCHLKHKHRFESTQYLDGPLCEECNIRFASDAAYELHMNVSPKHAGANKPKRNEPNRRPLYPRQRSNETDSKNKEPHPEVCELCGKSFKVREQLRCHIRSHTGERPFACGVCGKRFMQKTTLALHSKSHGDNPARYECGVCGQSFTSPSNRSRHMAFHRDARPYYECDICDNDFTTAEARDKHVLHVHRKVPRPNRAPRTRQVRHAVDTSESEELWNSGTVGQSLGQALHRSMTPKSILRASNRDPGTRQVRHAVDTSESEES